VKVQPDLTHLAFAVDSLEAFAKHLAKRGLKYSDGPTPSSAAARRSRSLTRPKATKSS
jgi:lactoylglutathione lyase